MNKIYIIIGLLIILIIIYILQNKNKENLDASNNIFNEAILNIASVYGNTTGEAVFNNIKSTGNITGNNIKSTGNITGNINNKRNIAQYIIIGNANPSGIEREDYWTLKEIEIFDVSGNNIALDKNISINKGTFWDVNRSDPKRVINGNAEAVNIYDGEPTESRNYHGNTGENELEIDLGKEYLISQIVIYNRYDQNLSNRLNGTSVKLLDKDRNQNRIIHTGNWHQTYSKEYNL